MAERTWWQKLVEFIARLFGVEWREGPRDDSAQGHEREHANPDVPASDSKVHIDPDQIWVDSGKMPLDPQLRVALSLIELGDPRQIFERTGIHLPSLPSPPGQEPPPVFLPLHIEITEKLTADILKTLDELHLEVPKAYLDEADRNENLRNVTARMKLTVRGPTVNVGALRENLRKVIADPLISRVNLATSMTPCDAESHGETLGDFGLPVDRKVTIAGNDYTVDGKGVVIGIIDDGCCYAHWNFLRDGPASRILYIWDQGRRLPAKGWTTPPDFPYGCELINVGMAGTPPIDAALVKHTNANNVIDEDAVYEEIDFRPYSTVEFRPFIASTHGTHVMDIAAGNGRALFGREGVAPAADLIFVQLPPDLVAEGGPALSRCIQDGAQYIFARAKQLEAALGQPVPAVVNISFGNYIGPHDGSSDIEMAFDTLLAVPDRAIVISAGNGFAAQCHAQGRVRHHKSASLHWLVPPFDESMNLVEIWYTGPSDVALYLTPPGATRQGPVPAGGPRYNIFDEHNNKVGYIDHVAALPANGDNQIQITLNATWDGTTPLAPPVSTSTTGAPAPSGTWVIELEKTKASKIARFHAWIERDEPRRGDPVRRRQSRFADDEARPGFTLAGIATGTNTIAVGAYDTATGEMAEYSACGPTRPSTKRPTSRRKPEICAPAAADARGRGVLSASTRFSLSTRLGGTSASAPHIAGLAALLLQLNRDVKQAQHIVAPLPIAELRRLLKEGALAGATLPGVRPLHPNRHQAVDDHQPYKQSIVSIWKYLIGHGRAHAEQTLKRI
jgi:subtilisin family serine protease